MKKQTAKRKRRVKLAIYIGILGIACVCIFMLGKNAGMRLAKKDYETAAKEKELLYFEKEDIAEPEVFDPLILVNKNYRLPEEYEVELIKMPDKVNRAAKEAYEPLCDMLAAGRKEGLNFEICSSYRDVKVQERLFSEDVEELMQAGYSYEDAYEEVAKETMPPGHSEHSTGLAFDIVALDYQLLDAGQEQTDENKWLQEHCAEYGFILRYPKGKEDITDISYESWHFRYVGVEAAAYIMEHGITLEEYLEQT